VRSRSIVLGLTKVGDLVSPREMLMYADDAFVGVLCKLVVKELMGSQGVAKSFKYLSNTK